MTWNRDELLARKKELLAIKKWGLENDLAAALLAIEELFDIRHMLDEMDKPKKKPVETKQKRAEPKRTPAKREIGLPEVNADRKAYQAWLHPDAEDSGRKFMQSIADEALSVLTDTQSEYFSLSHAGWSASRIAARYGVEPSTVTRTLARARSRMARYIRESVALERAGVRNMLITLDNPHAAAVFSTILSPVQITALYLHIVEGLTLREMEDITGSDYTSLSRDIKRGILNIEKLFARYPFTVVVDLSGLDDLAYNLYCSLQDLPYPNLPPPPIIRPDGSMPTEYKPLPKIDGNKVIIKPFDPDVPPGKTLSVWQQLGKKLWRKLKFYSSKLRTLLRRKANI